MIDELVVRNLGVIESARLEPSPALTVITGETGAGKTLLLGALRLLLGGEARSDLVGPFDDVATVEGRFLGTEGEEVVAGRRLPRDGRSRAYLDGAIASARALDGAVADLVEVVGQHDQLALTRPGEARALLDRALDEDGRHAVAAYREAWEQHQEVVAAQRALGGDRAALARELDLVTFQSEEIDAAELEPGDDVDLQRLADRLRNADEIAEHCAAALSHLQASREAVGEATGALRRAVRLDGGMEILAEAVNASAEALADLAAEVRRSMDTVESDPGLLETIEARLTALGELKRKYGRTLQEILEFGSRASTRRAELETLLARAEAIDRELAQASERLAERGRALADARRRAAGVLTRVACDHLRDLGFDDPVVEVQVVDASPGATGADTVDIFFASDSRLAPGPVGTVASGGELSRLILALRLAGGSGRAGSLVFDEVDAGVGGATALAVGRKLAALATDRQVLCVTHLPQLAAFADRHYVVERQGNTARVREVGGSERVAELARMLAGLPESERGRDAAEELLEMAASR